MKYLSKENPFFLSSPFFLQNTHRLPKMARERNRCIINNQKQKSETSLSFVDLFTCPSFCNGKSSSFQRFLPVVLGLCLCLWIFLPGIGNIAWLKIRRVQSNHAKNKSFVFKKVDSYWIFSQ